MTFRLGTPAQDVAVSASDAGGSAVTPSTLMSQLAAAQATIAELTCLLGAAHAELKSALEAQHATQDLAIKLAVLEAKQAMQAEIGALQLERQGLWSRILHLQAQWEEWRESEATGPTIAAAPTKDHPAVSRDALGAPCGRMRTSSHSTDSSTLAGGSWSGV